MALPQLRINKQITVRENQSIEKYLQQVQTMPLLTIDQEIEYTRMIKRGIAAEKKYLEKKKKIYRLVRESKKSEDVGEREKANKALRNLKSLRKRTDIIVQKAKEAQDKIVVGNLRFVISVAKAYQNRGLSINDLINEGNMGLMVASLRFDETLGFKFISYGVSWVRHFMLDAMKSKGRVLRIPGSLAGLQQKVYKAVSWLTKKLRRPPTPNEIAERIDLPLEKVLAVQESNIKSLAIDEPFKQGEDGTLLDVVENNEAVRPEEGLERESLREKIRRLVNKLDSREREVIFGHYGFANEDGFIITLEELGQKRKLTRERVRQVREEALRKLRVLFQQESDENFFREKK